MTTSQCSARYACSLAVGVRSTCLIPRRYSLLALTASPSVPTLGPVPAKRARRGPWSVMRS